jgi:DNA replication regulator SLD2
VKEAHTKETHRKESTEGRDKKEEHASVINIDLNEYNSDDEIENGSANTMVTELGPTPQANGKVLSILDQRMTPRNSSPLKRKLTNIVIEENNIFKTPTKVRLNQVVATDSTPGGSYGTAKMTLSEKLMSIANKTPSKTPIKTPSKTAKNSIPHTPNYLGKMNLKFDFEPIQVSPTKVNRPTSPIKLHSPNKVQTPTKPPSSINFQVSPSPLKLHRFLSKKISEVFNDFKAIQDKPFDHEYVEQDEEEMKFSSQVEVCDADEPSTPIKKRQKTQKRSTRRWKIKPREDITDGNDSLANKDIHNEIDKLNEKKLQELSTLVEIKDEEEVESSESDDEYHHQSQTDTKGKIKPHSVNYQRLKINDPRTKRFKNRFRR